MEQNFGKVLFAVMVMDKMTERPKVSSKNNQTIEILLRNWFARKNRYDTVYIYDNIYYWHESGSYDYLHYWLNLLV